MGLSYIQRLAAKIGPQKLASVLTEEDIEELRYIWRVWARPEQIAPPGDWRVWLALAGRGWGKSRTGAEFIREQVENGRAKHIALVGETAADARDVMVELSESSITKISPPWFKPKFEPTKRRLVWPNGAVATIYSGDDPDQLRGPQHDLAWLDELAKYRYPRQTWDNLMFGLRQLGPDGTEPRILVTTTPRPTPLVIELARGIKQLDGSYEPRDDVIVTGGSSWDNRGNLAKAFLKELQRYEGTRLGRQEIHREILDESEGALWSHALIDEHRVDRAPDLDVVVVAVDPMTSEPEDVNRKDKKSGPPPETGIVTVGRAGDHIYVVGDASVSDSPKGWAERAIRSWRLARADRVVGEKNQGGAMVKHTIHSVDPDVPVTLVHASRGKKTRAEPVASLYEQGRVHHVGVFPRLEDQMTTWVPGSKSPDRMDALVWAVTDLLLKGSGSGPTVGVRVIG